MHDDPVQSDESLYRRIPASQGWYNFDTGIVRLEAFKPTSNDIDGLSITRAKFTSKEKAAVGRPGKQYYVATLKAASVYSIGLTIKPDPTDDDAGHSQIPEINYPERKSDSVIEWMKGLADVVICVDGPYQS